MDDVALHRYVKTLSPEARWKFANSASGWAQRRVWGTIANGNFEVKEPESVKATPVSTAPGEASPDKEDYDPSPLPEAPSESDAASDRGAEASRAFVDPSGLYTAGAAKLVLEQLAKTPAAEGGAVTLGEGLAVGGALAPLVMGPGFAGAPQTTQNFTQGDTGAEPVEYKDMDGNKCDRPVVFDPPSTDLSLEATNETILYVQVANVELKLNLLSPSGRVPTKGTLRTAATAAAKAERNRAELAGTPYSGVVGHGIDTTWTGSAVPPIWLDQRASVNSSLGAQSRRYPLGYKPQCFIYGPTRSTMTQGLP